MLLKEILLRATGFYKESENETGIGTVHVERDSVCMGDDCTAPNAVELPFRKDEMLSEFMVTLAESLPRMSNVVWAVYCRDDVIGYVYTNGARQVRTMLRIKDVRTASLGKEMLYCSYYYEMLMADKYPECKNLLEKVRKELEG